jgi:hypothetical protein
VSGDPVPVQRRRRLLKGPEEFREARVDRPEGKNQMIKPKRTAAEQVEDEADRRALNPILSRQTIAESQAEPEFQENHKRLKADRLAREAKLKAK